MTALTVQSRDATGTPASEDWTDMMDMETSPTRRAQARGQARIAIVGAGRLGTALAGALTAAGVDIDGPLGRGDAPAADRDIVLLCVPDAQIEAAAAALAPGPAVGHCSAATTLDVLAPHLAFSLHPLMTVTLAGATFAGATAAIAGATPEALGVAEALCNALGIRSLRIDDADRAAYHAAASVASNYLVVVEDLAERLAATVGLDREPLVALVQASVANWATLGGAAALTGPVARGDETTVARQRAAVAERAPADLEVFDALTEAARRLAAGRMAAT